MRGKTSLVVVAHILGIATVLLLLVISISSSTLGVAAVARFSEVVESGVVVTPVRLRSRVLMVGLGRETTVRGGIHTCQRIWGEAGEALVSIQHPLFCLSVVAHLVLRDFTFCVLYDVGALVLPNTWAQWHLAPACSLTPTNSILVLAGRHLLPPPLLVLYVHPSPDRGGSEESGTKSKQGERGGQTNHSQERQLCLSVLPSSLGEN